MSARASKAIIAALASAVQHLESLTDDFDGRCSVSGIVTEAFGGHRETVKQAVRPYVTSWVLPDVVLALRWAKGEDVENEAKQASYYRNNYRYQLAPSGHDAPKLGVRATSTFTLYTDGGCDACKRRETERLEWHETWCQFYKRREA